MYEIPVPKNKNPKNRSLAPMLIMVVDTIGLVRSRTFLKVLFDPGSAKTLIKASVIPRLAKPVSMKSGKKINTIAGSMKTQELARLNSLRLLEFDKNCRIEEIKALIFDNECKYDIFWGRFPEYDKNGYQIQ